MKLLGSTGSKITAKGGNVPYLEIIKVMLVHCNIANSNYQHDSRVLLTFIANKSGCYLLVIIFT